MEPSSIPAEAADYEAAANDSDVDELLSEVVPEHPALRRLAQRRTAGSSVEATITSYDRMHHRHNRS